MMNKMESLRAGVAEMRTVAQKLNQWADDLEASIRSQEVDESDVHGSEQNPVEMPNETSKEECSEKSAATEEGKSLTLPEVRAILAEKCAAGFGTQVKALIESYGASSLKDVPAASYGELVEAVKGLGGADA